MKQWRGSVKKGRGRTNFITVSRSLLSPSFFVLVFAMSSFPGNREGWRRNALNAHNSTGEKDKSFWSWPCPCPKRTEHKRRKRETEEIVRGEKTGSFALVDVDPTQHTHSLFFLCSEAREKEAKGKMLCGCATLSFALSLPVSWWWRCKQRIGRQSVISKRKKKNVLRRWPMGPK